MNKLFFIYIFFFYACYLTFGKVTTEQFRCKSVYLWNSKTFMDKYFSIDFKCFVLRLTLHEHDYYLPS